ncbi:MAG: DUF2306 domain-containing protein [Bacteroidota bacterium]
MSSLKNRHPLLPYVRIGIYFLAAIIIPAAMLRYLLPHEWHVWLMQPLYGDYVPSQLEVLASIPIQEFLHRVGGSAYVIIGILQFSKKLRKNRPRLHRNLGKIFLLLSVALGVGGALMSIVVPFSGIKETIPTVFFSGMFMFFTYKAYVTARAKQFLKHREWVIRNFAIGIAVATIRFYYVLLLYGTDLSIQDVFATSVWMGFVTNMVIAEIWIDVTRKKARVRKARPVAVVQE